MSAESLLIVAAPGASEFLIRRSRFLGFAAGCGSPADAEAQLARLRAAHPRASHHVYAWRLPEPATEHILHRFDDDGEPGGTAGRPLLQLLEARGVIAALLVVVRYFGGIKLGAGGLVRAYAETGARALDAAELRPLVREVTLSVTVPYERLAAVEGYVAREGLPVLVRRFDPDPALELRAPADRVTVIAEALRELTGGRVTVALLPERRDGT